MAPELSQEQLEQDFAKGNSCLLSVTGRHFLSDIISLDEGSVCLTFPGRDYPVTGMRIELEFHDEGGFNYYESEVSQGPLNNAIIIARPTNGIRNKHRDSCRVPTDLTVQVRDQVHIRRHDAPLLDISAGGALLMTDFEFSMDSTLEMTLSLPNEPTRTLLCTIVHMSEQTDKNNGVSQLLGVRFIGLDPQTSESIRNYIWQRLTELYGGD